MDRPDLTSSPSAAPTVDALEQLRRQQLSLGKLFFAFHLLCERDDTAREKQAIADRIGLELALHVELVDGCVLGALSGHDLDTDLVAESRARHAAIREMAEAIASLPDDPGRDARVEALGEYVDRHLTHERDLLFPRLRQAPVDLKALGRAMAERREAWMAEHLAGHDVPEDESADPVGRRP